MSLTVAAPTAVLAALIGLVPIAVALFRLRTDRRVQRELELAVPPAAARLARPAALACVFGMLGLAAAQPAVRLEHTRVARSDAEIVVVLDSSRSMLASEGPNRPARYLRAVAFAHRLHAALPDVPTGLSSLTNRVLPYLFPTSDTGAYNLVLDEAYGIQRPPPALTAEPWVTTFDPLNEAAVRHFFSPEVRRRVLVVLSDGETRDFAARSVLRNLRHAGTTPVVVRFWHPDERIYRRGRTVGGYRATRPDVLAALQAAGWPAYPEADFGAVLRRVRSAIGSGPAAAVGYDRREYPLAPILAFVALAPLLLLLAPAGRWPRLGPLRRRQTSGKIAASAPTSRSTSVSSL
jgi:hypothetical protein